MAGSKTKQAKKLSSKALRRIIIFSVLGILVSVFCLYTFIPRHSKSANSYIFDKTDIYDQAEYFSLTKKTGKDFKILQLTDTHFTGLFFLDNQTEDIMRECVKKTEPDLIIITGDLAFTPYNGQVYKRIVKIMDSFDIFWTFNFGNHDSTGSANKARLVEIAKSSSKCIFSQGPSNIHGVGNFIINIKDSGGNVLTPLIIMDSNEHRKYDGKSGYDYIYPDQVEWYKWAVNGFTQNGGVVMPSLLFIHIPFPEYFDAYEAVLEDREDIATLMYGKKLEPNCAPMENTGLFDEILSLGSTKAVFCGHDHINDYAVDYKGVKLVYGLNSGMGSYGNDHNKGGTLITITDGGALKSIAQVVVKEVK